MNKNDFITFKFLSNFYFKYKQKKLNSIEHEIELIKSKIEQEKNLIENNKIKLDNLNNDNLILKKKYSDTFALFINKNKTFYIRNNNYKLSPWDNIFLEKASSNFILQTKYKENIYVFDSSLNDFLEYFRALNFSIIVLSVEKNKALLQIRLKNNEN